MTRSVYAAFSLVLLATAAVAQPGQHFMENWDDDQDGTVTVAEVESRRSDIFTMFDANEDEVLDAAEYVAFDEVRASDVENAGGFGRNRGLRRAVEGMTLEFNDVDGNGDVSKAEFLSRSSAWIDLVDRDGSGTITAADFGRN